MVQAESASGRQATGLWQTGLPDSPPSKNAGKLARPEPRLRQTDGGLVTNSVNAYSWASPKSTLRQLSIAGVNSTHWRPLIRIVFNETIYQV